MSARAAIKRADVARAIGGAVDAGLKPGQFEVRCGPDGVRIITFDTPAVAPIADPNPWDSVSADGPH